MTRPSSPPLPRSGAGQGVPGALKRRATIDDVAQLANVSKKTVSRVINQSPFVKEETRERIGEIMQQLGYAPDPQARGLAFRRSFLVGLIYDNPDAQMVVSMQQGVLDGLRGSGFELVVHPCNRFDKAFMQEVAGFIDRQRLYGVILLPPVSENDKLVALIEERGCRYVRIGSAALDEPQNIVISSDRMAAAEVARHLVDLGHRRIGFIAGPPGFRSRKEREAGFIEGLRAKGVEFPGAYRVDGAYTYESGVAAAQYLLKQDPRPTAIFASNDEMAAGVYHVARQMGLAIPRDLSVVGFDDTTISRRLWPPLTTVRWPILEMGQAAAEKVLRIGTAVAPANGEAEPFPAHFVVRDSTAPPQ